MDPERLRRVREIFERVLDVEGAERSRLIDEACADDDELRRELLSLLDADRDAESFLEQPAIDGAPPLSELVPLPIERIGPYRMRRRIGAGGMSEVFLAVRDDDEFERAVAIKIMRWMPGSDELLARFRVERQILAGLDHPNIATMLDGGTTSHGLPYLVMEHIDGIPIDRYCDRERLSVAQRVELFRLVCSAVQYAHRNLIVHRDIKASNILVDADGVPKLLDFGIAKLLDPDSGLGTGELTRTSVRPMTPRWASPEQVLGRPVTTSTDVYSLGVLLYKLLTGHLPYQEREGTAEELRRLVVETEPQRPSAAIGRIESAPDPVDDETGADATSISRARGTTPAQLARRLDGDLDRILLMALRKEPGRRYVSVEQFSEDLRRSTEGRPVLARPDTWGYRAEKFVRRNWLPVGVGLAFVALLAGFAVTMTVQARSIASQRDQARRERDRAERVQGLLQELFSAADPLDLRGDTPSALEMLDHGAERVNRELADEPETRAALLHTMGITYRNLGALDRSRSMLESALRLRRAELGPGDPDTARTMAELGELEQLTGNLDRSVALLDEALAAWRAVHPDPDPAEVAMLNDLGAALRQLGRLDEAEARYREALEFRSAVGDDAELATTINNLGTLMLQTGRRPEAEQLFRDVLDLRRRLLGDEHPFVAQSLSNLGATLGMQGRFAEAAPLLRDALAMYRRLLAPDHPALLEALNNVGKLSLRTGDLAGAEALFQEAIASQRSRLGDDHPKIGHIWGNLAEVAAAAGDLTLAVERERQALAIRRRSLSPDHPDVVRSLVNLGQRLGEADRSLEALAPAREAVDIASRTLADDHELSIRARALLEQVRDDSD